MVAQEHAACDGKSPGDVQERDNILPRAIQSTPGAFCVRYPSSPGIPTPFSHCPKTQTNKFWEKYPEKQPWFKTALPSGSLQDYCSLTMGRVGLHPSHFCSEEGTRCPTHHPQQCKLKDRCIRPRHLFPWQPPAETQDRQLQAAARESNAVPQLPRHSCHWAHFKTHILNLKILNAQMIQLFTFPQPSEQYQKLFC